MKYDFLLVGSGLFNCVFAHLAIKNKKKALILEKRDHPFGNCYTYRQNNIDVHTYGPHIFHTNNPNIWNFVNQFATFNNFIYSPKVSYGDRLYSFPINLMTLYQIWGVKTPKEAIDKIEKEKYNIKNPQNLEEWFLSKVGEELYYTFFYGYTKKQWNTEPRNLPCEIGKRLPIRYIFNENYFNDQYQGIPLDGYSLMMQNMIQDTDIILETNFLDKQDYWRKKAKTIIYTGPIDEYYDFHMGYLDYRSLRFEHDYLSQQTYQGTAAINYTDLYHEYTRIIEHKYFVPSRESDYTIITKEYPENFNHTNDRFYPINNSQNNKLYNLYRNIDKLNAKLYFCGRLGRYQYYNMDQIVASAIKKFSEIHA
jgi:UDP-galactopyranose mutase